VAEILPDDGYAGTLVGRVNTTAGPSVVAVRADGVFDITAVAPTVADLCNAADPVALARSRGDHLGSLEELVPALLAPIDLQAIKAAGVTFAVSLLERLIEEHAKGDLSRDLSSTVTFVRLPHSTQRYMSSRRVASSGWPRESTQS